MPEELALLQEWKETLGLHDWYILLQTNCKKDELMDDAGGDVEYIESTKQALIRTIDPNELEGNIKPFNFEETLVHELLHCKFALIADGEDWDNDLQLRVLHQVIDDIAKALVRVKHENSRKEDPA